MTLAGMLEILAALEADGVRYLVVGGVAVNAHGYLRLTQDLDLVIDLSPGAVDRGLAVLGELGFTPTAPVALDDFASPATRAEWRERRNMQVFSLTSARYPATTIDLFVDQPFDFELEYRQAMLAEMADGQLVRFVRLESLIDMKRQAGRPRDLDDAAHLQMLVDPNPQEDR